MRRKNSRSTTAITPPKYNGLDAKWQTGDPIDGATFQYLMGLDALRISLGHEPVFFPLEQVVAWISVRADQIRDLDTNENGAREDAASG